MSNNTVLQTTTLHMSNNTLLQTTT